MRYWFNTEFIEDGKTIDLISIGIVSEDGREFYAENADCDLGRASLVAHLQGGSARIRRPNLRDFVLDFIGTDKPEIWAYYADYDWVVLCQLFGTMMDLPKGWPMYCRDVKQLCDQLGNPSLPTQGECEHHALAAARWTKRAWEFLNASATADSRSAASDGVNTKSSEVKGAPYRPLTQAEAEVAANAFRAAVTLIKDGRRIEAERRKKKKKKKMAASPSD